MASLMYHQVYIDDGWTTWEMSYEWADKSVHPVNVYRNGFFVLDPPDQIKDALVDLAYKAQRAPDDVDGDDNE